MAVFVRTAKAEDDLVDIWLYVAQDSTAAADRLLDSIDVKCRLLAANHRLRSARPDIAQDLCYFPTGSYLILYREIDGDVEIVRVIHGARSLPDIF